jgi:hypothetical protein
MTLVVFGLEQARIGEAVVANALPRVAIFKKYLIYSKHAPRIIPRRARVEVPLRGAGWFATRPRGRNPFPLLLDSLVR